jgi:hypothetical protein
MTPKEDAKRIVVNFKNILPRMDYKLLDLAAKHCALITVEELIAASSDNIVHTERGGLSDKQHWESVKAILQNL